MKREEVCGTAYALLGEMFKSSNSTVENVDEKQPFIGRSRSLKFATNTIFNDLF